MGRAKRLFALFGLSVLAACTSSRPAVIASGSPSPKRPPVIPARPVHCGTMPMPGPATYEYQIRDCFGLSNGATYQTFGTGTQPDDRATAVVIFFDDADGLSITPMPHRYGPLDFDSVRSWIACFHTKTHRGVFLAEKKEFFFDEDAAAYCATPKSKTP